MTLTNFQPIIWDAQMKLDFRESAIAANLVNREFEGVATAGNTVRVNTGAAIVIKDYKTGVISDGASGTLPRTTAPDAVASTKVDLLIDQEKSFDFLVDDIDRAQVAGNLDSYTLSAGQGLAEDADKYIFATISGAKAHLTASSISTGDAAFNIIRDLRKALNKLSVPGMDRVIAVNAEFEAILLDAASKITNVDRSGSPAGLREASIGRLLGFDVFMSENLPVTNKPQAIAWYKPSVAYVSQIEKTEPLRDQDTFSDRHPRLHVYGAKVTNIKGVAAWTAS